MSKKISELPNATSLTGDEYVPVVQSGVTRKAEAQTVMLRLRTSLNLYVRPDGNDLNSGFTNTPSGAFLTLGRAFTECKKYNTGSFGIEIHLAAGTYNEATQFVAQAGFRSAGDIIITGDVGSPSSVVLGTTLAFSYGYYEVRGVRFSSGKSVAALAGSSVQLHDCEMVSAFAQASFGGVMNFYDCDLSGNALLAIIADTNGIMQTWGLALSGTPSYSTAFCRAAQLGAILFYDQPSGAAVGKRYEASLNGVIETYGGGATYLPGDAAGTTATGGQYV